MVRFSQLSILALLFTFATGTSIYAESAFDVGRELQRRGDYSAAEQSYRTFLHQEPRSVPALTNLGVVLAHQGRFHEAIEIYRKALSIAPEALPVKIDLALAYYRLGAWNDAITAIRAVLQANPHDRRSLQLLAICYSESGHFAEAAAVYRELLPSNDPSILIGLSAAYRNLGRTEDSDKLLSDLLSTNPDAPEVHFLLGLAEYARQDYERARISFGKALRLAPNRADSRFYLGATYFKQRQFDQAIDAWKLAAGADPQYFPAAFALGSLYSELGRYREAEPYLARSLSMRPHDALTQFEMGRWCLLNGELSRAAELLESASRANPKSKQTSILLAQTYRKLGWADKAAAQFARSRNLYRDSVADDWIGQATRISRQETPPAP
ncbi:MAG TPA: tetratricopeptide repeat protein [Bryobacteraceae bacterium]|nr:tetratricopeptide repeat protein [Bryobacteraceae bacterium]